MSESHTAAAPEQVAAPTGGSPTTPPTSPPPSAPEGQQAPTDWRAAIADEKLRDHAGRFTSVGDLAKAHLDLRSKLSTAIIPPGKDATSEDIAAYRKALGVPEKVDGYKLPDGLNDGLTDTGKSVVTGVLAEMHKAGSTQAQVDAALSTFHRLNGEALQAQQSETARAIEKADADLRREWGKDFDGNVQAAQRAAKVFGGDDFAKLVSEGTIGGVPLANHPAFIKAFAQVGRRMSEDGFQAAGALDDGAAATIDEKIRERTEAKDKARRSGDHAGATRIDQEIQRLYSQRYGDAPVR